MLVRNLLIGVVTLGLTGLFLALSIGLTAEDRTVPVPPTPTPRPTAIPPTPVPPTATPSPPIAHADACRGIAPTPSGTLAEYDIYGNSGSIIGRIYCDGGELRYVTFVDEHDQLTRVTLFIEGRLRVKLYYTNWVVTQRQEFDAAGYPVPDYSTIPLPNAQISPYRHELVRVTRSN